VKVLVVGGGGREHALAWSLARSPSVSEVLVAPGNAGTATENKTRNVPIPATDLAALVELARSERPDLVVLDVMLPHRDGLQILSDLSSERDLADVPVILLTAKTLIEDRRAGWRAGCAEFIPKPFSPNELVETVGRVRAMSSQERSEHRRSALARLGEEGTGTPG